VDEWVILLEGEATLKIDTEIKKLHKGEFIYIPAHTPHEVLTTQKGTLWLALYMKV
jgi:cupin 2 domain-containing protein